MLIIIFLEMSIAVATTLGGLLVGAKFIEKKRAQDLYVLLIFIAAAVGDLGMLFSQIAFNLQNPLAYIGIKVLLYCIVILAVLIWFYIADVYNFRSRIATLLILAFSSVAAYYFVQLKVDLAFQEGIIIPIGDIVNFVFGFVPLSLIIVVESLLSLIGLKKLEKKAVPRFRISRVAGALFLLFFI